jgi:DNA polymerase III delta prime subunit
MANFDLRNQEVGTQYIAGRDIIYQQVVPLTLTEAQQKRNRTAMLDRVRTYWIKGVLDRSLSGTSLALGLHEQSNVVSTSRHMDSQHLRNLPPGTPMLQVYTDADGELLILGEPGSGKTTLLLELARDLLDRATLDEIHPIPVVLNLSSWTPRQQHLSLWLVEELVHKYMVPRKLAVSWVANDQLLPLLDGLDEVAAVHRGSCVEAINAYHREHGLVPLVVSCRNADYETLQERLQLHSTVVVQPLTAKQVYDYLSRLGEQTIALRFLLHNDPTLQELATTPLLLSILMLAYQDKQVKDLISTDAPAVQRQRILAHYVERMLQQKGIQTHYQQPQVVHWLGWLARQLALHSQTEFSIERIQPDWLLETQGLRVYEYLGVRLPGVLFGIAVSPIVWIASSSINDIGLPNSLYYIILMMFIGGLIGGLFSENPTEPHFARSLIRALVSGVFITLVAALLYKLNNAPSSWYQALSGGGILGFGSFLLSMLVLNGFVERMNTEIFQMPVAAGSLKALWFPLLKAGYLKNGIVVGLIYGLAFWLDNLLSPQQNFSPFGGLVYGLILGISGIILGAILGGRERTVQPVEVLVWSWSDFGRSLANLKHLRNGVLIGAACGFVCGLTAAARAGSGTELSVILSAVLSEGWVYAVSDGLAVGLSYWLFIAFLQGISGAILDAHLRIVPNQGIRLSVRNGLFMGLISAGVSGVFAFLAVLLRNVLSDPHYATNISYEIEGLMAALIVGLAGGLLVGLLNGWLAYIRHTVLRILLSRAGVIPSNYPGFLDEAAARILLRKVGGGYIFIHRLLLDYFVAIRESEV